MLSAGRHSHLGHGVRHNNNMHMHMNMNMHMHMLKHDNTKVLKRVALYRRPGHEARTRTPLYCSSVARDASSLLSVVGFLRRLHMV